MTFLAFFFFNEENDFSLERKLSMAIFGFVTFGPV